MQPDALPYILLLGLMFGSTLIASRFGVGQFAPLTYVALRLTLASAGHVMTYLTAPGRHWPQGRTLWRNATILGVIGTAIPMTGIVSSLQYQSSGVTSLLVTTGPALTVLLAHFLLPDEPLTRRKMVGVALALSGAMMLIVLGESGLPDVTTANPTGYLLVIGAIVSASASDIFVRRNMRDMDTFDVASIRMFSATICLLVLNTFTDGYDLSGVNGQGYFALGFAALVGTFFGQYLGFYNVQRFGASTAAITAYIIPVVAAIGGVLVLGETITPGMIVGMVTIISGVVILNQRRKTQPARNPVPARAGD